MEPLNYHHLRLFWAVAREGHLSRASAKLHLTPQTVSAQVRSLEQSFGEPLFRRTGRRLVLTEAGQLVQGYADEIFSLGRELQDSLQGQASDRPLKIHIGAAMVLPKLIVHRIIEPALKLPQAIQVLCREGTATELLADLSVDRLDLVLSDSPIPAQAKVRAYNHLLGTCGVSFMAHPDLARRLRPGFPESLSGAPVLLPSDDAVVRRDLDGWFDKRGIQPSVVGEFEDSALLKIFGQAGEGFFAIPDVVIEEVSRQYEVEEIGRTEEVKESFYAISVERRIRQTAVAAICEAARSTLFSKSGATSED